MIKLTTITSHNPPTLGKTFHLTPEGELDKTTAGEMLSGACEVVTLQSIEALADFLPTVRNDQAITASLPRNGIQSASIVTKGALGSNPNALARTKDDFCLPRNVAGLLTLDYDPKGRALNRDELWAAACKVAPALAETGAVHWYSGSSLIFHGDDEKRGISGQRIYIPMTDLSDLERVGKVLLCRSWLAGLGFVEISKSGAFLVRGLFDASMFQVGKLDFIGGAVCHDGLEQRRGLPTILNQGAVLDTRQAIPDLNNDEQARFESLLATAKEAQEDERLEVREVWKANRKPALVKRQIGRGASTEKAEALAERILNHALGGILSGDFEITLENGAVVPIRELLAAPEKHGGMMCLDPLEPEYCDYKPTGHLNLTGGPANLYSHAHGGAQYRLEAGESRTYPEWKHAIESADDDPDTFIAIARGIDADPFLSETARTKLKKELGRVAKVSVKALDADTRVVESDDTAKVIRVSAADFAASVNSAMVMLPKVPDVYEHHGNLVEAICNSYTGETLIKRLDETRLGYRLSTVSKWKAGEGYCGPNRDVLAAVLGAGHWPGVCQLAQVAHSPQLSLDGNIVDCPGYFAENQTLAVFDAKLFPKVELSGSDCLKELLRLFKESAFESAIDESAAIAMCLTISARSMFDYAPGWIISGTDYGAGKTYTAEIAAEMGGGAEIMRWPNDDSNQGKVIFAVLNSGKTQTTIFDNLLHNVKSPTMAAVLSCGPSYQDRELSTSQTPTVSAKHNWIWTGNCIGPAADLARRVLTIRLNPGVENPALRQFKNDPRGEVRANPGYWQMLCLKLMSDYLKSGVSVQLSPLATYGTWSKVVRGSLVWLGLPDPIEALTRGMEDDPDREDFAKLLHCWQELYGNAPQFLNDVVKVGANGVGDDYVMGMRYIMEDIAGKPDGSICKVKLGTYLGLRRERVLHRMRLKRSPTRMTPGYAWWVETV